MRSVPTLARFLWSGALAAASSFAGCGGTTSANGGDAGVAAYARCDAPGQCVALVPGCCGCGAPTLAGVTGVNSSQIDAFRAATCGDPNPVCPACPTALEPNLVAFCESGACRAHDVRKEALSTCTTDADCMLRGADCCESCVPSSFELIALAKARASDYLSLVCAVSQSCPACMPSYPTDVAAVCGASRHCEVVTRTNVCPETVPVQGTSCTLDATVTCEYGDDIRPGCRIHATCPGGAWQLAVSGCPPLPTAGQNGCPSSLTTGACATDGLACDMGGGGSCVCSTCAGPCSQFPIWSCAGPPTTPGCPTVAPRLGAACDTPDLVCLYGAGCAAPFAAGRRCKDGAWIDEPMACPQ